MADMICHKVYELLMSILSLYIASKTKLVSNITDCIRPIDTSRINWRAYSVRMVLIMTDFTTRTTRIYVAVLDMCVRFEVFTKKSVGN